MVFTESVVLLAEGRAALRFTFRLTAHLRGRNLPRAALVEGSSRSPFWRLVA